MAPVGNSIRGTIMVNEDQPAVATKVTTITALGTTLLQERARDICHKGGITMAMLSTNTRSTVAWSFTR